MKYKIFLILFGGLVITTIIYFNTRSAEIDYLALGDGISSGMTPYHVQGYNFNDYLVEELNNQKVLNKYYKNYSEVDESVKSLINKIDTNYKTINTNISIKQAIKKSKIITLSLGMDEFNNFTSKNLLTNRKINDFINNYSILIDKIKKITTGNIYVIGLYETNLINENKIEIINQKLKELCYNKNINFVDISHIINNKDYFNVKNNYYPNYKGHNFIYEQIINKLTKVTVSIV